MADSLKVASATAHSPYPSPDTGAPPVNHEFNQFMLANQPNPHYPSRSDVTRHGYDRNGKPEPEIQCRVHIHDVHREPGDYAPGAAYTQNAEASINVQAFSKKFGQWWIKFTSNLSAQHYRDLPVNDLVDPPRAALTSPKKTNGRPSPMEPVVVHKHAVQLQPGRNHFETFAGAHWESTKGYSCDASAEYEHIDEGGSR